MEPRDQWTQGTRGKIPQGAKIQSCLCFCLRLALYTPCSTRLLPRDLKALPGSSLLCSGPTVQPLGVRTEDQPPATQRRPLAGSDVPASWHLAGHNGSLFYSHLGRGTALRYTTGHTAPRIHFRLDCHGAKKSTTVRCCYVLGTFCNFSTAAVHALKQGKNRTATMSFRIPPPGARVLVQVRRGLTSRR